MTEKPRLYRNDKKLSLGIDTYIRYIYYLVLKYQEENKKPERILDEELRLANEQFTKQFNRIQEVLEQDERKRERKE